MSTAVPVVDVVPLAAVAQATATSVITASVVEAAIEAIEP
jgi:hypothetical protein